MVEKDGICMVEKILIVENIASKRCSFNIAETSSKFFEK